MPAGVRQRIGIAVVTAGALVTVAWSCFALLILATGDRATEFRPWLWAVAVSVAVCVAGGAVYGGLPRVTYRAGWLVFAWGVGLFCFGFAGAIIVNGLIAEHVLHTVSNRTGEGLAIAMLVEAGIIALIIAGIRLLRRHWGLALAIGAAITIVIGVLDSLLVISAMGG